MRLEGRCEHASRDTEQESDYRLVIAEPLATDWTVPPGQNVAKGAAMFAT
jgi:hypothetical protein